MTLIVCVKSNDGIVVAGDKRSSTGDSLNSFNDNAEKVFKINERVCIAGAGDGYDSKAVIEEIKRLPQIENKDVDEVKDLLYNLARNRQSQWYSTQNMTLIGARVIQNTPQFGFLIVGYTHLDQPKVYSFSYSDTHPTEIYDYYSQIGITEISQYLLSKLYRDDMGVQDIAKLASLVITETSRLSTAVSDDMDIIKILPTGVQNFSRDEKRELKRHNLDMSIS